jgi:hypothetical protein
MVSPQQTYDEALLRACEAHLARVKAVRDIRDLAISKANDFGEHDRRTYAARSATYAAANQAYDQAIRTSEAQRAKDEAIALDMFQARRHRFADSSPRIDAAERMRIVKLRGSVEGSVGRQK